MSSCHSAQNKSLSANKHLYVNTVSLQYRLYALFRNSHNNNNDNNNNPIYKASGIGFRGAGGRSVVDVNQKLHGISTAFANSTSVVAPKGGQAKPPYRLLPIWPHPIMLSLSVEFIEFYPVYVQNYLDQNLQLSQIPRPSGPLQELLAITRPPTMTAQSSHCRSPLVCSLRFAVN